ncbi:MAG TPA: hypothetical protein VMV71_02210 [Candidatus Paceibacterota bacterium]|nr:hypothetical protein [Candidatus Paceibacterota bacterium]
MADLFKSKRIKFPAGKQKLFIEKCEFKLGYTLNELAEYLNVNIRTVTDWKREKFIMPAGTVRTLSRKAKVAIPRGGELRDKFWYTTKGARKGGLAAYKKHGRIGGDPIIRKKRWREWWEKEGKFKSHPIINVSLPVKKPRLSSELAEFVGIILGDGGISKYQVTITLHHIDDKEYMRFVVSLIKKLFGVSPGVHHSFADSTNTIFISRIKMVDFLTQKIGLKAGNKVKHQVDIPEWIKRNKKFQISCVRGLVDTDGSVFIHTYFSKGKLYQYKKLNFTNMSKPLLNSVYTIMKTNGLTPSFSDNKAVRLESVDSVRKYFEIFGPHNPKHLKRYRN